MNGVECRSDSALRIKSVYLVGLADYELSLVAPILILEPATTPGLRRWYVGRILLRVKEYQQRIV